CAGVDTRRLEALPETHDVSGGVLGRPAMLTSIHGQLLPAVENAIARYVADNRVIQSLMRSREAIEVAA
ncbi:MAG TPA: hypothetical protein VF719_01970, partial [Abditibacteriaceae bacterium]